jgi:hypothetical protein
LEGFPDIATLTAPQRKQLEELGLISPKDGFALWQGRKKYHWQQTFLARKTLHIRHEYTPVLGGSNGFRDGMGHSPEKFAADELKTFCMDDQLRTKLESLVDRDGGYDYVDFILTTANTWKTPIEDFTLLVERPRSKNNRGLAGTTYVTFCWDGPVTKIDADHFSARTGNLVPSKELRIGFFSVQPRTLIKTPARAQ